MHEVGYEFRGDWSMDGRMVGGTLSRQETPNSVCEVCKQKV